MRAGRKKLCSKDRVNRPSVTIENFEDGNVLALFQCLFHKYMDQLDHRELQLYDYTELLFVIVIILDQYNYTVNCASPGGKEKKIYLTFYPRLSPFFYSAANKPTSHMWGVFPTSCIAGIGFSCLHIV
jgi:hypothetical protein